MWLQSEIVLGMYTKISKLKYCINMLFVLLICGIQNNVIDGITLFMTKVGTKKTDNLNNLLWYE